MSRHLVNIYRLGVKELWSLWRDPMMMILIVYALTLSIYVSAAAAPETLNKVAIAVVDEDRSPLSARILSALYPPHFHPPVLTSMNEADAGMDAGMFTFSLVIPAHFQRDVLAGDQPDVQLNVDATRMSQAFVGSGAIQQIVIAEVAAFLRDHDGGPPPVDLALRMRFNPNLEQRWFVGVMDIISIVTTLSIVLTGTALIREREHGTIEHLLVMPVTPTDILLGKVWSMALVVLAATAASMTLVVQGLLAVPIEGSLMLFGLVALLHLVSTTSMGTFMATVARTMPQFGLLMLLVLMPMQMLSGGATPRESMPEFIQTIMLAAPTTHFVAASQAILYRGAGIETVWPQLLAIIAIAAILFSIALSRFRKTTMMN